MLSASDLLLHLIVRSKERQVEVIFPVADENPQVNPNPELEQLRAQFADSKPGVNMGPAK